MRKGNLHLSTGFSMLYYTLFETKVDDRQKLVFIQLKFWKNAMKNSYHILLHLTPCAEKFCKTICVEVVWLVLRRRADRQTDARQDTKKHRLEIRIHDVIPIYFLHIHRRIHKERKGTLSFVGSPTFCCTHSPFSLASRIKPLCQKLKL